MSIKKIDNDKRRIGFNEANWKLSFIIALFLENLHFSQRVYTLKKKSVLDAFLRRFYKTPLVPVFKSLFQDTFI